MSPTLLSDWVCFDDARRSVWRYPGGEVGVRAITPAPERLLARIHHSEELLALLMYLGAVRGQVKQLAIPYLPYARQDRVAVPGDPVAIEVLAELLVSSGVREYATIDAHSPASVAAFAKLGATLTDLPTAPWLDRYLTPLHTRPDQPVCFVVPDKGARPRTAAAAAALSRPDRPIELVYAEKQRDPASGALTGFGIAADSPADLGADPLVVVVDDICDGGGTFMGVATALVERYGPIPLHLWTTHGIHSRGLEALARHYRTIGCTDSFRTAHEHPALRRIALQESCA
ncbi:MAG: hypothetical protein MUE46_15480 [Xanthomonadales bacterium]|jgi:ribose-phosphate pyrophosphokinase|nr:hypothetical protein [Xanthomonadales bacterium]